jgi:hypothetical protein
MPPSSRDKIINTGEIKTTFDHQIGGDHYTKQAIQPIQYIYANKLDYFQGNVVKYVTRYKLKNGMEDLKKALHYLEMIIQQENGKWNEFK